MYIPQIFQSLSLIKDLFLLNIVDSDLALLAFKKYTEQYKSLTCNDDSKIEHHEILFMSNTSPPQGLINLCFEKNNKDLVKKALEWAKTLENKEYVKYLFMNQSGQIDVLSMAVKYQWNDIIFDLLENFDLTHVEATNSISSSHQLINKYFMPIQDGETVLHVAIKLLASQPSENCIDICKTLIHYLYKYTSKAKENSETTIDYINFVDNEKNTALYHLCKFYIENEDEDIREKILDLIANFILNGANIFLKNSSQKSAFELLTNYWSENNKDDINFTEILTNVLEETLTNDPEKKETFTDNLEKFKKKAVINKNYKMLTSLNSLVAEMPDEKDENESFLIDMAEIEKMVQNLDDYLAGGFHHFSKMKRFISGVCTISITSGYIVLLTYLIQKANEYEKLHDYRMHDYQIGSGLFGMIGGALPITSLIVAIMSFVSPKAIEKILKQDWIAVIKNLEDNILSPLENTNSHNADLKEQIDNCRNLVTDFSNSSALAQAELIAKISALKDCLRVIIDIINQTQKPCLNKEISLKPNQKQESSWSTWLTSLWSSGATDSESKELDLPLQKHTP